jgi:CRP/FNR family transcriptional regulator, cyclic AMP receptor protein
MTPLEAQEIARNVGWLSRQPKALQELVLGQSELANFRRGQVLYGLDDDPGGSFGVASGLIDVIIAPGPFAPRLVHIGGPGWWVGESAAATGTPRRAELKARTDSWTLYVSPRGLETIAAEEPRLWRFFASLTVQHLDNALFFATCMSIDDPTMRLACTIARLVGLDRRDGGWADIPVSQADFAELSGLSRNSISRSLARLETAGCLQRSYGRLAINVAATWSFLERQSR